MAQPPNFPNQGGMPDLSGMQAQLAQMQATCNRLAQSINMVQNNQAQGGFVRPPGVQQGQNVAAQQLQMMQLMQQMQQMQQPPPGPHHSQPPVANHHQFMARMQHNPMLGQNQQFMQQMMQPNQVPGVAAATAMGQTKKTPEEGKHDRHGRESRDSSYGRDRDNYGPRGQSWSRDSRDFRGRDEGYRGSSGGRDEGNRGLSGGRDDGYRGSSGSRDRNRSPPRGFSDRGRSRDRRDQGDRQSRDDRPYSDGGEGRPRYGNDKFGNERGGLRDNSGNDGYRGEQRQNFDRDRRGYDRPPQRDRNDRPPRYDSRDNEPSSGRRWPADNRGEHRQNNSPTRDKTFSQGPPRGGRESSRGRPYSNPPSRNSSYSDLQQPMDVDTGASGWQSNNQRSWERDRSVSQARSDGGRSSSSGPTTSANYQANCKAFFAKDREGIPSRYRSPPKRTQGSSRDQDMSPTKNSDDKPHGSAQRFTYTKGVDKSKPVPAPETKSNFVKPPVKRKSHHLKAGMELPKSKADIEAEYNTYYGRFNEKKIDKGASTKVAQYIESTPAGRYLTRDMKTGNMIATAELIELEDKFEHDVLNRSKRAREGRTNYKYPERSARLTCCHKDGCSHESEDDDTDVSDIEDGEIKDSDGEEEEQEEAPRAKYSMEVQARLDHPERYNKNLCYNDRGESNSGPLCKCSRRARRFGVRHGLYAGEERLERCRPDSNNLDKLYHYRIKLSHLTNFSTTDPTVITWDERSYTFEGFSLLTHQRIEDMPAFRTIMYCHYYTIELIEETVPAMFTVRSLDLVSDYLFYELFELMDLRFVHDQFEDGCRQIHVLPRFTRPLPEDGVEFLAMPQVMRYLLTNSTPMIEEHDLANLITMSKKDWEEKILHKYQFTLVNIPGMRPSTLRVDNMDLPELSKDLIFYPQILHYVMRSETLLYKKTDTYSKLLRQRKKHRRYVAQKMTPLTNDDVDKLNQINEEITKAKYEDGYARREMILELSCQGFFGTGLKPDVTQYALLMPKVVDTVRFSQSLAHLQKKIGYKFKNLHHLQLSLSHTSYMSGFCHNMDHMKNTLTNCGLRKIDFGTFPVWKEIKFKKRGLKTLLEVMSEKYRQYTGPISSNERLEFLGDAVLEFLTTVHLFYMFPRLEEGGLSTYRTALVKNDHLTQLSKMLGIQHYLLFSHGPDLCYSKQFDHALANAFEAILGAIFLDGGLNAADAFLARTLNMTLEFPEFLPVWSDLPLHPLQEAFTNGDRELIESFPALHKLTKFEEMTGLKFDHIRLLARAFTHPSMKYTDFAQGSNQTLEFLGDSVLQIITSEHLFKTYPNHHEGHLTLLRSALVNNATQAQIYKDIGIAEFVFKKEDVQTQPKERADYVEALIGALYVDQGLDVCVAFCEALFFSRIKDTVESQDWNDDKSLLQQCCLELRDLNQTGEPDLPVYKLIGQTGPTHSRIYKVTVYFKGKRLGQGEGRSVHKAEFDAAANALEQHKDLFPMLMPGTKKLFYIKKFRSHFEKYDRNIWLKNRKAPQDQYHNNVSSRGDMRGAEWMYYE